MFLLANLENIYYQLVTFFVTEGWIYKLEQIHRNKQNI